jgi:hypothetical protein
MSELTKSKGKRGRKSKQELMSALYNQSQTNQNINLNIIETIQSPQEETNNTILQQPNINNNIIDNNDNDNDNDNDDNISSNNILLSDKPPPKKRGRKPKGGKIIQNVLPKQNIVNDKPNVILHLKCSMKDLNNPKNNNIESFDFLSKNNLLYDNINGLQDVDIINKFSNDKSIDENINHSYSCKDEDNEIVCKDNIQEIWKKIKQLEYNLHINNINNKRSACFWDTCNFDNPPIYIPKHFIGETYHVYGCFCSPECAVAYLMNENIDTSTKFERYHLLNHIYSKIYDFKNNIKPAPNPFYMLDKYYGNLNIQEFRSLLRNERLFLIVDKPLTRILPELHEDNEDFILNNKIIPSNNNNIKNKMIRKKQTKNTILNENFGISINNN